MKQTSQRSLLFRQNVNRTEAEWVHFLDGYRKALIEFDMNKFGDDWHTAEDIVEEIFLDIVREPRNLPRPFLVVKHIQSSIYGSVRPFLPPFYLLSP